MADLRPLPGLSADWGPSSAERSAGLSCRLCVAGCQVLRRRATQSPGPACTPGGAHSSGRVEGPAGYAARGGGPPPICSHPAGRGGRGLGGGEGRFGETCSLGTPNRREGAKGFLSCQCTPSHHSRPRSRLLWGSPQPLPEGGREGGQACAAGVATREPELEGLADPDAATRGTGLCLPVLGAEHPRAPLSPSGFGDTGSPRRPLPISLILEASRLRSWTVLPGGAVSPGVPPGSRFRLRGRVCSASLFGTREPSGTQAPQCPLRPRRPLGGAGTSARLWPRLLFQVR